MSSNRSGQRAPVLGHGEAPPPGVVSGDNRPNGTVPPPPEHAGWHPAPTEVLTPPPMDGARSAPADAPTPDNGLDPLAGINMNDPEALLAEAIRLRGVQLSDDPTADLTQQVVFPGNPRDVMRQAEAIARAHDPFREHAQVSLGESVIHVQNAVQPLIAVGSSPDARRSLNDMAEVSVVARMLHAQPKFTIMLPNGAENKQYDHPFGINGFIIYVLTGVPSIVPQTIYEHAVSAGLCLPQRAKDYELCPRVSDLVKAAKIRQENMGGSIMGAGISRD